LGKHKKKVMDTCNEIILKTCKLFGESRPRPVTKTSFEGFGNNLDMVLKFMTNNANGGAGRDEAETEERRPQTKASSPLMDFTLLSMGMGMKQSDEDSISDMMDLTEFGLKDGVKSKLGNMKKKLENMKKQHPQLKKNNANLSIRQQMRKNENLMIRRRPPLLPTTTTTTTTTTPLTTGAGIFPHFSSKTPYEADQNSERPPTNVDDAEVIRHQQMMEQMEEITKLEEIMLQQVEDEEKKLSQPRTTSAGSRLRTRPMMNGGTRSGRPPATSQIPETTTSDMFNEARKIKTADGTRLSSLMTRRPDIHSRRPMTSSRPEVPFDEINTTNPFLRRNPSTRVRQDMNSGRPTAASQPPSTRHTFKPKRPTTTGTGFTNISTIFLSFFYLFSKLLLNCF
jgi:hypothetical protein